MTDKPIHATMPSGNDIEQKQSGIKILSYIPFFIAKDKYNRAFFKKIFINRY
ncbi:MAG: hypothetical protein ACTJLN_04380 [Rickettsia amblyommatis]